MLFIKYVLEFILLKLCFYICRLVSCFLAYVMIIDYDVIDLGVVLCDFLRSALIFLRCVGYTFTYFGSFYDGFDYS
jgi:hypothetical protein